jgi:hypothetical protein
MGKREKMGGGQEIEKLRVMNENENYDRNTETLTCCRERESR